MAVDKACPSCELLKLCISCLSIGLDVLLLAPFYFIFFLFLATLRHIEWPSQGSDLSRSFDLCGTCSNTRSPIHCASLGVKPVSQHSRDTARVPVPHPCATAGTPPRSFLCKDFIRFCAAVKMLSNCDGDPMAWKTENMYYLALYRKVCQCLF